MEPWREVMTEIELTNVMLKVFILYLKELEIVTNSQNVFLGVSKS